MNHFTSQSHFMFLPFILISPHQIITRVRFVSLRETSTLLWNYHLKGIPSPAALHLWTFDSYNLLKIRPVNLWSSKCLVSQCVKMKRNTCFDFARLKKKYFLFVYKMHLAVFLLILYLHSLAFSCCLLIVTKLQYIQPLLWHYAKL